MTQKITYEYVETIVSSNARSTMNPGSSLVNLPQSIFLGQSSSVNLPRLLLPRDAFLVVLSDVPCFELAPKLLRENVTCEHSFFCWGLISFSHLSIYLFIYLFVVFFLSIIIFISFRFFFILFYLSFFIFVCFLFYNFFILFFSCDSGVGYKFRFT